MKTFFPDLALVTAVALMTAFSLSQPAMGEQEASSAPAPAPIGQQDAASAPSAMGEQSSAPAPIGQQEASSEPAPIPGLRGTLPVPVIQEPSLQQLDTSKGQ